jgi:ElaB/YqjD/DUF883 family membrane-anchored ribosome-binding protein
MQRVNADGLMRDLSAVAADVDALLKSTAGSANQAIADARERIEISLRTAKQHLEDARLCTIEEAMSVAQSTDAYLRKNAWKAIGVAGSIGLLLGAIVGLEIASSRTRRD